MVHVLTADLGNSSLKLRLFRCTEEARGASAQLVAGVDLMRATAEPSAPLGPDLDALRAWLQGQPCPTRVALSSVAGDHAARAVAAALAEPARGRRAEVIVAPDCGLAIRCREPEHVGRDRLYAARAAAALAQGDAIVVDCGTALTVDAVSAPVTLASTATDAAGGVFHGGAIAPGPALLARALGEGAAQLFTIELRAADRGARALGRDTSEALASGVVHGLRGAAERLVREVGREAGFRAPTVVVTGGAAELLLEVDAAGAAIGAFAGARHVPDLVHHGLLLALGLAPPRRPASAPEGGSACAS